MASSNKLYFSQTQTACAAPLNAVNVFFGGDAWLTLSWLAAGTPIIKVLQT